MIDYRIKLSQKSVRVVFWQILCLSSFISCISHLSTSKSQVSSINTFKEDELGFFYNSSSYCLVVNGQEMFISSLFSHNKNENAKNTQNHMLSAVGLRSLNSLRCSNLTILSSILFELGIKNWIYMRNTKFALQNATVVAESSASCAKYLKSNGNLRNYDCEGSDNGIVLWVLPVSDNYPQNIDDQTREILLKIERNYKSVFPAWFIVSFNFGNHKLTRKKRSLFQTVSQNVEGLWPAGMLYEGSAWTNPLTFPNRISNGVKLGSSQMLQDLLEPVFLRVGDVKRYNLPFLSFRDFKVHRLIEENGGTRRDLIKYSKNSFITQMSDVLSIVPQNENVGNHTLEVCGLYQQDRVCGNLEIEVAIDFPIRHKSNITIEDGKFVARSFGEIFPKVIINDIATVEIRGSDNFIVEFTDNYKTIVLVTELKPPKLVQSTSVSFVILEKNYQSKNHGFKVELAVAVIPFSTADRKLVISEMIIKPAEEPLFNINNPFITKKNRSEQICTSAMMNIIFPALIRLVSRNFTRTLGLENTRLIKLNEGEFCSRDTDSPPLTITTNRWLISWLIFEPMSSEERKLSRFVCEYLQLNLLTHLAAYFNQPKGDVLNYEQQLALATIKKNLFPYRLETLTIFDENNQEIDTSCLTKTVDSSKIHPSLNPNESQLYKVDGRTEIEFGVPFRISIDLLHKAENLKLCYSNGSIVARNVEWISLDDRKIEDFSLFVLGVFRNKDFVGNSQETNFLICPGNAYSGRNIQGKSPQFTIALKSHFDAFSLLKRRDDHRIISIYEVALTEMEPASLEAAQHLAIWNFTDKINTLLASNCEANLQKRCVGNQVYIEDWQKILPKNAVSKMNIRINWKWIPLLRLFQEEQIRPHSKEDLRCKMMLSIDYLRKTISSGELYLSDTLKDLNEIESQCLESLVTKPSLPQVIEDFTLTVGYPFRIPINYQTTIENTSPPYDIRLNSTAHEKWILLTVTDLDKARMSSNYFLIGLPTPQTAKMQPYRLALSFRGSSGEVREKAFSVSVQYPTWCRKIREICVPKIDLAGFPSTLDQYLNHRMDIHMERTRFNYQLNVHDLWKIMTMLNNYINGKCARDDPIECKYVVVFLRIRKNFSSKSDQLIISCIVDLMLPISDGEKRFHRSVHYNSSASLTRAKRDLSEDNCRTDKLNALERKLSEKGFAEVLNDTVEDLRYIEGQVLRLDGCKNGLINSLGGSYNENPEIDPGNIFGQNQTSKKHLLLLSVIVPICAIVVLSLLFVLTLLYCTESMKRKRPSATLIAGPGNMLPVNSYGYTSGQIVSDKYGTDNSLPGYSQSADSNPIMDVMNPLDHFQTPPSAAGLKDPFSYNPQSEMTLDSTMSSPNYYTMSRNTIMPFDASTMGTMTTNGTISNHMVTMSPQLGIHNSMIAQNGYYNGDMQTSFYNKPMYPVSGLSSARNTPLMTQRRFASPFYSMCSPNMIDTIPRNGLDVNSTFSGSSDWSNGLGGGSLMRNQNSTMRYSSQAMQLSALKEFPSHQNIMTPNTMIDSSNMVMPPSENTLWNGGGDRASTVFGSDEVLAVQVNRMLAASNNLNQIT